MKTYHEKYILVENRKSFTFLLRGLLRSLGIDGSVADGALSSSVLDVLRIALEQPNVSGEVTLTTDGRKANHYEATDDVLNVTLGELATGTCRLTIYAKYGTNEMAAITLELVVPEVATGEEGDTTIDFAAVVGLGGGGDVEVDPTLSIDGMAADAAATGNRIKELELFKYPNATIVGDLSINQGQVSGFSFNPAAYMRFPFIVDFHNSPFKIEFEVTTGEDVTQQENILDSAFGLAFATRGGNFVLAVSTNGTSWGSEHVGSHAIQAHTTYMVRVEWNGSGMAVWYSIDGGETWMQDIYFAQSQQPYPKQMYIGVGVTNDVPVNAFHGIINLNKAFLTINGNVVWQGMDDAGLSTRLAVDMSNIDDAGRQRVKDIVGPVGMGWKGTKIGAEKFNNYDNDARGEYSHAEGYDSVARGRYSHAENSATAIGDYSHAEGDATSSGGASSHAEGNGSSSGGTSSHAEGFRSSSIGNVSHAEGSNTTASGEHAHSEGNNTNARGQDSHAEGYYTTVESSGKYAHAEGYYTNASGEQSHAEGTVTVARGTSSHAEGFFTVANGDRSHVEGICTVARGEAQHVIGVANEEDTAGEFAFIIGNGSVNGADVQARHNALAVKKDGTIVMWLGTERVELTPTILKNLIAMAAMMPATMALDDEEDDPTHWWPYPLFHVEGTDEEERTENTEGNENNNE